jgi:hydrogenase maturation protease
VLVAGIGNVFFGDDGFGPAVVRRLEEQKMPEDTRIADYGIRGLDLAYELTEGWDLAILLDALPHGASPGAVAVLEPDADDATHRELVDPHSLTPAAVLALTRRLGGPMPKVLVVGCEPASLEADASLRLSAPVQAAVSTAAGLVMSMLSDSSLGPRVGPLPAVGSGGRWV